MISSDVLAVVVSYNGLEKTARTVRALLGQVGGVHIVDNGSGVASLRILDSISGEPGVSIELLGANRGVGYALNRGLQRARETSCDWLLTMDQDSTVAPNMIAAYGDAIENNPELVCLAPRILERTRKKDNATGIISYAITSGNLVRTSIFDQIGSYDEDFFIDCIDFDFSLRVRRAGYSIHRVPTASMEHQLGDVVQLPPTMRNYYSLQPPARRYYMYRNFMYMAERYAGDFPGFIAKLGAGQLILLLLIAFYDRNPLASYGAILRAVRDYVRRTSGPFVGSVAC